MERYTHYDTIYVSQNKHRIISSIIYSKHELEKYTTILIQGLFQGNVRGNQDWERERESGLETVIKQNFGLSLIVFSFGLSIFYIIFVIKNYNRRNYT